VNLKVKKRGEREREGRKRVLAEAGRALALRRPGLRRLSRRGGPAAAAADSNSERKPAGRE
jgi:hypothetical protein